ncbi:glutamate--tRNA ligase [Candidatus Curtissbacteria bacterium]|nr:glutamate--tRNA ligase [Candidatus Curtissbacteria bacterium]
MSQVVVRYAPSPTGVPHIGNIRTALFNFLFAKNQKGQFILRIEDTDQKRIVPGTIEKIKESLSVLGLMWDKDYKQSERLPLYNRHLETLKDKGAAYEQENAWWFKVPDGKQLKWADVVHGQIEFSSNVIEDFVIVKSDGFPTYHFASVVDDHDMKISHVLRGDEWISSTPKHLLLYAAFEWDVPAFVHLPPILGANRKKLSKREGARSVLEYIEDGYLAEAIVNFLALLGWAPRDDREMFSLDDLTREFSLERLNKNSPIFNLEKLRWFNRKYIQKLSDEILASKIKDFYSPSDSKKNKLSYPSSDPAKPESREVMSSASEAIGSKKRFYQSFHSFQNDRVSSRQAPYRMVTGQARTITAQTLLKIIPLVRDRMTTLSDFESVSLVFFVKGKEKPPEKSKIVNAKEAIESIDNWNEEAITKILDEWIANNNLVSADFKNTLRLAVFADNTPPIYPSLAVLTKEEVIDRIDDALEKS